MPTPYTLTSTAPGAEPVSFSLPNGWYDVTLAQYLAMQTAGEHSLLSILSGLPPASIDQLPADDVLLLCATLSFALDDSELLALEPTEVVDLGSRKYGLFAMATAHVNALPEGAPPLTAGPYLMALYRTDALFGSAPDDKVTRAEQAILASPVTDVIADCQTFIRGWSSAMQTTKRTPTTPSFFHKLRKRLASMRFRSASTNLLRSTASASRSA